MRSPVPSPDLIPQHSDQPSEIGCYLQIRTGEDFARNWQVVYINPQNLKVSLSEDVLRVHKYDDE